jgi:hypothetical protein
MFDWLQLLVAYASDYVCLYVIVETSPPLLLFSPTQSDFLCLLFPLTSNAPAAHLTGMDHLLTAPCVVNEGSPELRLSSTACSDSHWLPFLY